MTREQKVQVLKVLRKLQEDQWKIVLNPFYKYNGQGICYLLLKECKLPYSVASVCRYLRPYFRTWGEFSGDVSYPVSTCRGERPAVQYATTSRHYSALTDYGRARWRLIGHIADQIEMELQW